MSQPLPLPLFTLRGGLPKTARRLRHAQPVTIVWLGGSITQASPEGFVNFSMAWLREQFPQATIHSHNAGIGGTGSDLGAFRLAQDVLRLKPDLLVLEFAVNDSRENHPVAAAMEGIIRHTRRVLPDCEMALVYTLSQPMVEELAADRLPSAARVHEPVAEHYGLPSINAGLAVARQIHAGELTWEQFARDPAHPYPAGHRLYAATISQALAAAFDLAPPSAPAAWPAPLTPDPWDTGAIIPIPATTQYPGWTYTPLVNRGGWQCFDGVLESEIPGSLAELPFTGRAVGLYYSLGPATGDLEWAVDDGPWQSLRLFDDYAMQFWRPSYRVLAAALPPGPHRLRLRVSEERDPRATGHWLKLAALLVR